MLVILNLHDVYATDGSVAEFQCMGYARENVFGIKIDFIPFASDLKEDLPKNVTCQSSQSEGNNNVKIVTVNITIPAVIANNLTAVTCYFHDDELDYYDTTATLYVTSSKLYFAFSDTHSVTCITAGSMTLLKLNHVFFSHA